MAALPPMPAHAMPDFIEIYDDALSAEFCAELIKAFEASPHTVAGRTGAGVDISKKHSTDLHLNQHPQYQRFLQQVSQVTSHYAAEYFRKYHFALIAPVALTLADPDTGAPVALTHENYTELAAGQTDTLMRSLYRLGPIQAQKYRAGEGNYNYWHCEVYPQLPANEPLHRTLLFMFYLNDVTEGGQTEFYYQDKAIAPRRGRMVIAPAYFTHTHRGCTPISGDKYILTSWILFNRAEQLYGQG
ncbi:prolyl 4-hydroxylase subunit alpha [Chitinimonas prasina]|uniref:Prolyl 4-hydroxylase subunit alpha n=1 Tax=Chitinimonas prasina TaxID=1434937 RepID=A0ABQ5YLE8_9NEIS|nr:2OG-Fe(II) oxygenase [Chitinimonas prasina]GLR15253.1 prolyl 4-hydroxylase subunit alpha [Chitinimonas prasina]